jgi:outer membrane biosynthesis protein TonB
MADPIEAHYTPDGDDWKVAVKGRGRTLTGRAPGLIAARDRADQLVEQLVPQEPGHRTVVHMLNGDALEFTEAYLTARLARTEPAETPQPEEKPAAKAPAEHAAVPGPAKHTKPEPPPKPTPAPRTESQAAQPAAKPAETPEPTEETAPSGS